MAIIQRAFFLHRALCIDILQRVLSHWWSVWLPSPYTWFVFQSGTTMGGAASSCAKPEKAEKRVKRELTDPHKQALSFMASVTPSLLKSDSQMFKHHWSVPPSLKPHRHHRTLLLLLPLSAPTPRKLSAGSSLPLWKSAQTSYTLSCLQDHTVHTAHAHTLSSLAHKQTPSESERST